MGQWFIVLDLHSDKKKRIELDECQGITRNFVPNPEGNAVYLVSINLGL